MRSIRRYSRLRLAVLPLMLLFPCVFAETACAEPHLRQSFDMRVPVPPTPVTVAGESQLVYELHLTNLAPSGLALERLEITTANGGNVFAVFEAAALERRLYRPGAAFDPEAADARLIETGMLAVVYLELSVEVGATPEAVEHRLTCHSEGEAREPAVMQGARISVETKPPVVIAAPLRDGPWAAIHDESWPRSGRVAFFEHLKPGSVRVQAGDRVRQGQVIGALGFTGQSTGPHLHFHAAERNSPLGAEGVPFVIDEFELLGRYPAFDRFGEERWTPLTGEIDKLRREERPPSNSVVRFR